jgi:hypothetical protein
VNLDRFTAFFVQKITCFQRETSERHLPTQQKNGIKHRHHHFNSHQENGLFTFIDQIFPNPFAARIIFSVFLKINDYL